MEVRDQQTPSAAHAAETPSQSPSLEPTLSSAAQANLLLDGTNKLVFLFSCPLCIIPTRIPSTSTSLPSVKDCNIVRYALVVIALLSKLFMQWIIIFCRGFLAVLFFIQQDRR